MKKRNLLVLLALVMCLLMVSCGGKTESASAETAEAEVRVEAAAPAAKTEATEDVKVPSYLDDKESPALAALVAEGKLPKLEDRLPVESDRMVVPTEELGKYGGILRYTAKEKKHWDWGALTEEGLFRFTQDGSGAIEPNIAKAVYPNDDATVWTIELREGMKWSDGEPLTADDLVFYYNHMSVPALNEDRTAMEKDAPGYYNAYTSKAYKCYQSKVGDKMVWATIEKIDDYKVEFHFASSKPSFPVDVAIDNKWGILPAHFFKDFVSRKDGVTDDPSFPYITEEQALENGSKTFGKVWNSYGTMGKAIGYYHWDYCVIPQVRAWIAVNDEYAKSGSMYKFVRNPYYFKVDEAGRQLPYIDGIDIAIINEIDQRVLKLSAGEIDFYMMDDLNAIPTIAENTNKTHKFLKWSNTAWTQAVCLELNQTVADLDKRALFQNKDFRKALSIAADRDLMCATISQGRSVPWQSSVPEGLFGYDPEWSEKWIDFNADEANRILDTLTEPWNREKGTYRTMKGTDKELEIIVSVRDMGLDGAFVSILQSNFAAIGVKLSEKVDAEIPTHILANQVEAVINNGINGASTALRADCTVPCRNYMCWYGLYGKWYEDGKTEEFGGIKPTGDVMKLVELYDEMKAAKGADRDKIVRDNTLAIYDLHKENIWEIGFMSPAPIYLLINRDIMNFPEKLPLCDEFRKYNLAHLEQIWFNN